MALARLALAVLTLAAAFLACLVLVRAARRRSAPAAGPLALALLVCVEALFLRSLSAAHAVRVGPVLALHALLVGAAAVVVRRVPGALPRPPRLAGVPWRAVLPLAVLFALAATSALAYRPNNWDSMTYHLARVAHWVQRQSVEVYPTGIWRQNLQTPGAEYLLLVLQLVSGSDRLASLVQLSCWVLLVAAVVPLARTFGASRPVARAGAVLVGAAPMAILQASSTQNDLVSAATAAAVALGCVPLLHRRRRYRAGDLLLLLVALAAAVLVKPSGLLFLAPLLALAAVCWARGLGRRAFADSAPALVLGLVLAGPLAAVATAATPHRGAYVYEGLAAPGDRLRNAVRGALRNLPFWDAAGDRVAPPRTEGCVAPHSLCLSTNRAPHEDGAGNPALAFAGLAALTAAGLRWRRLRAATRLGVVVLVVGWLTFHGLLRDNPWITRLQLPGTVALALALGALPPARGRWRRAALAALVAGAFAHGVAVARRDVRRPLTLQALRGASAPAAYYLDGPPGVGPRHDAALAALGRAGCTRLGLWIGGDSYDYPLTWRAMQAGATVQHVLGPDAWPCAVFSDRGDPPPRPDGLRWRAAEGAPGLFVPDAAGLSRR